MPCLPLRLYKVFPSLSLSCIPATRICEMWCITCRNCFFFYLCHKRGHAVTCYFYCPWQDWMLLYKLGHILPREAILYQQEIRAYVIWPYLTTFLSPNKFITVFVQTVCLKLINFASKIFPHFILGLASNSFIWLGPFKPLQFVSLAEVFIFFGKLLHVHTFIEVLIFYGTASHLGAFVPH